MSHHMLNKNSIKTILNVKHTCIDNVKMLADSSIMIEVHATKGQQCRCGIVILQILPIKKALLTSNYFYTLCFF